MEEALPETVEYIPTHPIFGPRTTSLDNQVIVLTPTKKGKWYDKVYNYLDGKHMRIIETTAEKHDYMMSIVQVLTHFSFISTASAIEKLQVDISETEDYESPIYNLMIDMIARIVAQNPYLTYYIQSMNNNGPKIRNTFAFISVPIGKVGNDRTTHAPPFLVYIGKNSPAVTIPTYAIPLHRCRHFWWVEQGQKEINKGVSLSL